MKGQLEKRQTLYLVSFQHSNVLTFDRLLSKHVPTWSFQRAEMELCDIPCNQRKKRLIPKPPFALVEGVAPE